ncbi:orotate phosphoribosyltransferase [Heyndrickxia acidicola]|uniref:Orotate phosphoribosyltransferase n=1 Tax=Heyndrickxia acidicola TaxID=209389 RepID=A0ABU6MBT3_9BACI|nr:orotate phosphoribosyltransferase [Heyndrickxia acidicola]MED1202136.1 orotate phosphoribosyltransferase [Heyndrickxia acidicola]
MEKKIAEKLLEIEAVFLSPKTPFTWSSGLKSPIYCDNRLTLSYPEIRKEIAKGLTSLINEQFPEADLIAGTATAGIPHAAWVSDQMNLPMCYVRSKAKAHGKGNQVEGKVESGQKVVVVEDLISTGGSVITCVNALREAGCEVLGVVSIFTYGLNKGKELLKKSDIHAVSLTNYSILIETALEKKLIEESDMGVLKAWVENPEEWSAITHG